MRNNDDAKAPITERLSSMEAGFLYLDGPNVIHQGVGCMVLDRPISYEHYVRKFEPLTRFAIRYRQRAVPVPLRLHHHVWELDPDFDIRYHIREVVLEPPGTDAQLHDLVSKFHHETFDLNRPLWKTWVINGLEGGRSAVVTKMHHTISDAGGIMAANAMLFDDERIELGELPDIDPNLPPELVAHPSTGAQRVRDALVEHAQNLGRNMVRLPWTIAHACRVAAGAHARAAVKEWLRFFLSPAEKYPFNNPPTGNVGYATIGIPLDDIRAIRAAGGGTINDVLVTVVAGALERYGKKHNIRVDKRHALIAFTANLRQDKSSGRLDNRSAASMLAVPFDRSDPRERLRWVTEHTRIAKETGMAQGVWNFIAAWRAILTPPGLALLYSALSIPSMQRLVHKFLLKPPGHLYFSNIRAPEFPLYLLGAKLISRNPVPPLIPMLSLASAAVTMHKFMRLSFSGDANLVPDVQDLANFAADAFQELREAYPEAEYADERPSLARADRTPADV